MVRMKTVGQVLKEARESKNIATKQVSNAIKIRESQITALENGDYDAFTSDMHLKSFLRSYAHYLKLNEEMVMALYRRERNVKFPEENQRIQAVKTRDTTLVVSQYLTPRFFFSLFGLAAILGVMFFFYIQWKAFNTPPYLEIKSPKQNEVLSIESVVIEGFTGDPSVKVVLDGNEANYVDSLGNWRINTKFNEAGLKRFQIIATNQFNKKTQKTLDVVYKPEIKVVKQKIRIKNKSSNVYNLGILKDQNSSIDTISIPNETVSEIQYNEKIQIKNFDKNSLDLYFNDDTSPTSSIGDSKEFLVLIENNRPIIKISESITTKPTVTSTRSVTVSLIPTKR